MSCFHGLSTTLTIRNLDEVVKRKLRIRATSHQTSMEAEARALSEVTAPPLPFKNQ